MMNNRNSRRRTLLLLSALWISGVGSAFDARGAELLKEVLQIRVDGKPILGEADLQGRDFPNADAAMAAFRKNIVPIRRNSTIQLTVASVDAQGHAVDVTNDGATSYHSLAPSRLSVSSDGMVTAAAPADAQWGGSGDVAVLVVHETQVALAWNKVFFNVLP
ncbi:hypothetical protein [Noviherbaspirillum agri]